MKLAEALEWMDEYYCRIQNCYSSSGRNNNKRKILEIIHACPEVLNYWDYNPNAFCIEDRFFKKQKNRVETTVVIINHIAIDSTTQERLPPDKPGIYFIGNTTFNPYTNAKQYWVKVGMTQTSIKQRLKKYDTHSPSIYHIDYRSCNDASEKESEYHKTLSKISIARSDRNLEWWLVDEATYLEMCKKGLGYFNF